jgi:hypothetical protein
LGNHIEAMEKRIRERIASIVTRQKARADKHVEQFVSAAQGQ